MSRSDFAWVNFDTQFDNNNTQATRTFAIESTPLINGNRYLLIQVQDVEQGNHRILINNQDLPSFDIPEGGNNFRTTWMDRVPQSLLNRGQNTITIQRVGSEVFTVFNVMVQWREQD